MNREVEERLVAMYFDNNDFEKHAKETIETLDKLKKSMNLEDSAKGFDVFSKMKRNAGMEDLQRSANKLKETFGSIGTVLNKAFDIGTGPLRKIEGLFSTINGYVGKYLGFDFASKVVGSIESAVRSLTIQPISQGFAQYENEVDSVRTIMSSTGRSIEDVTKNLDDLRVYADKTIYSLQDMTSNLGKFTNNGVKLEDATKAMMGVSNAAALAGQGTQQASMAMYNISQAIGVGKMTSIDWKSIENANMATQDLKNSFIQVAAAMGELKKVEKNGITTYYYVKDSNGNEIKDQKKWTEVNFKNFRETLSKGWLTSDALTTTLMAMSGEAMSSQTWKDLGITDPETIKQLEKLGQKALEAAQQVRTFSKMMTTLKDSVASGWAQSFKFVFGDADEATAIWTDISNRIGGALSEASNKRNEILKKWKDTREVLGTDKAYGGENVGWVEYTVYGRNGREILIDSLKNLMDVFSDLGSAVKKAFGDVFKGITGNDLFSKTQAFEKFTLSIKEWLGPLDDSGSRLNKIYRIIRGVVSAFKLWKTSIKNAVDNLVHLLIPSADGVLDVLAGIGDFIYELSNLKPEEIIKKIGEKLKQAWEKIKGIFTPQDMFDEFGNYTGTEIPILSWLNKLWQQLASAGGQIISDLGLGDFVLWIGNFWNNVTDAWNGLVEDIKNDKTLQDIWNFMGDVWGWISKTAEDLYGKVTAVFTPDESGETPISKWINNVWGKIKDAWDSFYKAVTETGKDVLQELGSFLADPWNWIISTANKVRGAVASVFTPDESGESPISKWITNFWGKITSAWTTAVNRIKKSPFLQQIGSFFTDAWNWIIGLFRSKESEEGSSDEDQVTSKLSRLSSKVSGVMEFWNKDFVPNESGESPISKWISNFWDKITGAWESLKNAIGNSPFLSEIGAFFSDAWGWLVDFIKNAGATVKAAFTPDESGESPISKWITNFWGKITSAWTTAVNRIKKSPFLQQIGSFFTDAWNWIIGLFRSKESEEGSSDEDQVTSKLSRLSSKVSGVMEFWNKDFVPNESGESPISKWISNFWDKITGAWESLKNAIGNSPFLSEIGAFFSDAWGWLVDFIKNAGATVKAAFTPDETGASPISKWIRNFWNKIELAWTVMTDSIHRSPILKEIGKFLSNTWNWLMDILSPEASTEESSGDQTPERLTTSVKQALSFWTKTTEEIATDAEDADISESKFQPILDFFGKVGEIFEKIFNAISKFFTEHSDVLVADVVTFIDGVATAIGGILDALGKLFTYLGHRLKGEKNTEWVKDANDEWKEVDVDLEALGNIMETVKTILLELLKLEGINLGGQLASGLISTFLHGESLASSIRDIGIGVGVILGGIASLKAAGVTKQDLDTYRPYILTFVGAIGLVTMMIKAVEGKFSSGGIGGGSSFNGTKVLTTLVGAIEKVAIIWIVLEKLPALITAFADAKSQLGQSYLAEDIVVLIAGTLTAVMLGAIEFLGVSAVATAIPIAALGKGALAVVAVIAVMAGILAAIAGTVRDTEWSEEQLERVKNTMAGVKSIMDTIADVIVNIGDIPGQIVGDTLTNAGEGLQNLSDSLTTAGTHIGGNLTAVEEAEQEKSKMRIAIDGLLKLAEILDTEKLEKLSGMIGEISKLDFGGYLANMNFVNYSQGFTTLVGFLTTLITTIAETPDMPDIILDEHHQAALNQLFDNAKGALSIFSVFTQNNMDLLSTSKSNLKNVLDNIGAITEEVNGVTRLSVFLTQMDMIAGELQDIFVASRYPNLSDESNFDWEVATALERIESIANITSSIYTFITRADWIESKYWDLREKESADYYSDEAAYLTGWGYNLGIFIEAILRGMENIISKIDEHSLLTSDEVQRKVKRIRDITEMFQAFSTEAGIGSASWKQNYNRFREMTSDETFVDGYVTMIKQIYQALEDNEIGDEKIITFDGINIVGSLFGAIQEGLDDAAKLPDLDATNLTDKIIASIGLGKTAMAMAVRDMIQAGVNEVTTTSTEAGEKTTELIQTVAANPDVVSMLTNPTEYSNKLLTEAMSNITTTMPADFTGAMTANLSTLLSPDSEFMKTFSGFEEQITDAIPEMDFEQILADKGYSLVDEEGNSTGILADIASAMETLNKELEENPVTVRLVPVVDLSELTRDNLQAQLDGMNLTAPITLPSVSIDFTALKTELGMDEIKQKLDAIKLSIDLYGSSNVTATSSLGSHMDGIRSEIGNMHMVLDTGVLVAQMLPLIDQGLYNRALLEYRAGTSPRAAHYVP